MEKLSKKIKEKKGGGALKIYKCEKKIDKLCTKTVSPMDSKDEVYRHRPFKKNIYHFI